MKPPKILAALVLILMVIGYISSKSTIYMAQRDFKTWRRLSTAYGHEWVHRINDMKYKGIWINSKVSGSQYYFDEVLAHAWSTAYSGVKYNFMTQAILKSGQLYTKYFNSQVIKP